MASQGSGSNEGQGASAPGTNAWLMENMVGTTESTTLHATFACGHHRPIFQVAVHPDMEQTITNRLRRDQIICHTCQYFAIVREVQEEFYVERLRLMGDDPRMGPNNFDLLQMYYDMASTLGQRVNENQLPDAMNQCLNEFCRIIVARLSPRERAAGLEHLLSMQAVNMDTDTEGGNVQIIRRLTEAINAADEAALNDAKMKDPNSSSSPHDESMKDPGSPRPERPDAPDVPSSDGPGPEELLKSPSALAAARRRRALAGAGVGGSGLTQESTTPEGNPPRGAPGSSTTPKDPPPLQ
ncbi:hypothetical protein PG996_007165 [Apiospora saccharicola]|uniref:Uncharacterized protein n=1 Tax=Apiospora saccharicola TaxID=335842 RepID=A0ABR1VA19_9PEZI